MNKFARSIKEIYWKCKINIKLKQFKNKRTNELGIWYKYLWVKLITEFFFYSSQRKIERSDDWSVTTMLIWHLLKQSSILHFCSSLSVASPTQEFPPSDGGGSVHVRNLFRFLIPPPQLSLQLLQSPNELKELQYPWTIM